MTAKTPKYCKQKRTSGDMAFVEIESQRIYLGRYDSPQSKQKYHQLMTEWSVSGYKLPVKPDEITIVELIARFWQHANKYYRKPDGTPTSEIPNFQQALRPLKEIYSHLPVSEFSPLKLKAVQKKMVQLNWTRNSVNRMTGRIKMIFKWGTANELVPAGIYQALQTVTGLQRGRTDAIESKPVTPVLKHHIEAIRPYVSRQVWSLIQLQLHTAARGGELVKMRAIDIDMSGKVWRYCPDDHKTAHHGHKRFIYIGPNAQQIISELLQNRPLDAYLFSPCTAIAERAAQAPTHRRPNQIQNSRKTDRVVGDHYTQASYRRAIHRACVKADIPKWHPHQLRHNAGTFIRKEYGLEAAQLMLGHARADVTQIYAEIDQEKAIDLAEKIG